MESRGYIDWDLRILREMVGNFNEMTGVLNCNYTYAGGMPNEFGYEFFEGEDIDSGTGQGYNVLKRGNDNSYLGGKNR